MIDPLELASRHLGFQRDKGKHKNVEGDETVCIYFKRYCDLVTSYSSETNGSLSKKKLQS